MSMNRILEMLGLDHKPKTIGGRILKGIQIITIPLFIVVLAARPLAEERNQRIKENKEKLEEIRLSKRAQEIKENKLRENPELQATLDDLRNSANRK